MIPLPYSGQNRYKINKKERSIAFLVVGSILGLIVLFVFEIPHFSLTIKVAKLVGFSMLIGGIIGLLLGYRLRTTVFEVHERMAVILMVAVPFTIFAPTLANLSNRLLASNTVERMPVRFVATEERVSERFGVHEGQEEVHTEFLTFYTYKEKVSKIKTAHNPFPKAKKGDRIQLPIRRGLWGFDVIQLKDEAYAH